MWLRKLLNPKYYFIVILFLAAFLSFWKLGSGDVNQWDEAEYGTNAVEMLHNGDYINYYYAGKLDTWNAKPPLLTWSIVLCYKLFGCNAFALRFTSAIASMLFFIFVFRLASLYREKLFAFIVCLVLLSCKAIIGFHVGRTGDTDAMLTCFLTASVYYFVLYFDFKKKYAVFLFALFIGLAFYTKGTPALMLIPGLILYLTMTSRLRQALVDPRIWLALLMIVLIACSWIFIILNKGKAFDENISFYKSHNAIETLFYHDTFVRLTDPSFNHGLESERLFFFTVLDTRFNLWNYYFYLSVLTGMVILFHKTRVVITIIKQQENLLLLLSICMVLPLFLLFTFASGKASWYIAPLAPFISIIIVTGILYLSRIYRWFCLAWIPVLAFTLCRHFIYLNSPYMDVSTFFSKNNQVLNNSPSLIVLNMPTQDFFLYLSWNTRKLIIEDKNALRDLKKSQLIFHDSEFLKTESPMKVSIIDCKENYCISMIK